MSYATVPRFLFCFFWCEEMLGFVLKDRCDIHSDLLAVRIICPVSFYKEPKDTKSSLLTKTKLLTWILSLGSFHVSFLSRSLSLVYLSFNLRPSLHTHARQKPVWGGSKFAVNTPAPAGCLKICQHPCANAKFSLARARLVCSTPPVIWKSPCHLWPVCWSLTCSTAAVCSPLSTFGVHDTRALMYPAVRVLDTLTSHAVRLCCPVDEACPIPCLEKGSRRRERHMCGFLWLVGVILSFIYIYFFCNIRSLRPVFTSPSSFDS